jgi:hypothetical protein
LRAKADDVEPLIAQVQHRTTPETSTRTRVEDFDPDAQVVWRADVVPLKVRYRRRRRARASAQARRADRNAGQEQRDNDDRAVAPSAADTPMRRWPAGGPGPELVP